MGVRSVLGRVFGSDRGDVWSYSGLIFCVVSLQALAGLMFDAVSDTLIGVIVGAVQLDLWWTIVVGHGVVVLIVLLLNIGLWVVRGDVGVSDTCPAVVIATIPWATTSFLAVNFVSTPAVAAFQGLFFGLLGLGALVVRFSDLEWEQDVGFLIVVSSFVVSFIGLVGYSLGLKFSWFAVFVAGVESLAPYWTSLVGGFLAVLALNVVFQLVVKRVVLKSRLSGLYGWLDILPQRDSWLVIVVSTAVGVSVNVLLYAWVGGGVVVVWPGLAFTF